MSQWPHKAVCQGNPNIHSATWEIMRCLSMHNAMPARKSVNTTIGWSVTNIFNPKSDPSWKVLPLHAICKCTNNHYTSKVYLTYECKISGDIRKLFTVQHAFLYFDVSTVHLVQFIIQTNKCTTYIYIYIYIYKELTWCNLAVCLLVTAIILYMFRMLFASILRST